MSNGKTRPLGSGGFTPAGSIVNIVLVALVVVVLVLCVGVFVLYNHDKSSSDDARSVQQAFTQLNETYNDISGKYTALIANDADLKERYNTLNTNYKNVSDNYASLKNQSDITTVKLGEFMENDPTVAYTYRIQANDSLNFDNSSNVTTSDLVVTLYNVGKTDLNNVIVRCKIQSLVTNQTSELPAPQPISIPSLSKKQVFFYNLDNATQVEAVYVTLT